MSGYNAICKKFMDNIEDNILKVDCIVTNYANKFRSWFGCYFAVPLVQISAHLLKDTLLMDDKVIDKIGTVTPTLVEIIENKLLIVGFTTIDVPAYYNYDEEKSKYLIQFMREKYLELMKSNYSLCCGF